MVVSVVADSVTAQHPSLVEDYASHSITNTQATRPTQTRYLDNYHLGIRELKHHQ